MSDAKFEKDQSLPFSEPAQAAFLGYVLKSEELLVQVKDRIKSDWFIDSKTAELYDLYVKFFKDFGRRAQKDEFKNWDVFACKDFSKRSALNQAWTLAETQTQDFGKDFLTSQLTKWYRAKIWQEAAMRSADFFNSGKLTEAQDIMSNAVKEYESANFEGSPAMRFDNPLELVASQETEHTDALTTGLKILDEKLNPDCKGGSLLRGDTTVILAPVNIGKCLGIDTPVIMSDGKIKKVQDIVVGEQVMGPDGKPRTVLSTTTGVGPLYRVYPKNGGDSWVCNDVHVLSLKARRDEYNYKQEEICNIPLNEYLNKSQNFKEIMALWHASLDFESKDLPIPPYILGLWLGDGHSSRAALTSADKEIVEAWRDWILGNGDEVSVYSQDGNSASSYAAVSVDRQNRPHSVNSNGALRALGVLENKHVPHIYATSSRAQRLQLLAGIIDSDGYVHDTLVEITQKNRILAEQIAYVARSLGYKVRVKEVKKQDQNGTQGTYCRLFVYGAMSEVPTLLPRKKCSDHKKKTGLSGFRVKEVGIGNYYGFTLDGDHLFLLGDFTVTHNTTTLITMSRHNIIRGKAVLFISLEGRPRDIMEKIMCSVVEAPRSKFRAAAKDPNHELHKNVIMAGKGLQKNLTYISMNKPGLTVEEVVSRVSAEQSKRKAMCGAGYDMVVIDYPGILKSSQTRKGQEHRHEQDYVYRQFVQQGLDENVHMLLAAQTNRNASRVNRQNSTAKAKKNNENTLLAVEDVAEAFGIVQAATNVLTLNRDSVAMAQGFMTLYISKSRSSETDWAVACKSNFGCSVAFSNKLGAAAYRGSGAMSDKLESLVKDFNGTEVEINRLRMEQGKA